MKTSQAEWTNIRHEFLSEMARRGVRLALRDRVWAVTPAGAWVALPGTSDSPNADKWWLGCDPQKLLARRAIGVILLCQARGGSLHAIGLPEPLLRDVEARLSNASNGRQVFFNVARREGRFLLQLRGGEVDVTRHLGDFSWVGEGQDPSVLSDGTESLCAETPLSEHSGGDDAGPPETREGATHRFFAIAKGNALHPLDDVALDAGSLYLVELRLAQVVPGNTSLRRIVARGGPDLPSDFAERHDYYAHGAGRR